MKPTNEQIQIVKSHMIEMATMSTKDFTNGTKFRIKKEVSDCQKWVYHHEKLIEDEQYIEELRLQSVKSFIGI